VIVMMTGGGEHMRQAVEQAIVVVFSFSNK
jgi:hypothetical protein